MDLVLRGVEFDATFNQAAENPSLPFVNGTGASGTATQYGLVVDACRFASSQAGGVTAAQTDLLLKATAPGLRCSFVRCRFDGFRSIRTEGLNAEFDRCYRSDFSTPGASSNRLREFTEVTGTPGARTQSLRTAWQDTPWLQTGARVNVLKNSDLALQTPGTSVACNANFWDLEELSDPGNDVNFVAFGKWGQTGISNLGDVSPGPESFGAGLPDDSVLFNTVDFVDLETTDPVVLTYQGLVRVKGRLTFKLANDGDPTIVYDAVTVGPAEESGEFTSPTLVTLRLQRKTDDEAGSPQLRIENDSGAEASLQVYWQQAWAGGGASVLSLEEGLRNQAHVRTPGGAVIENTYVWGLNATSVRAAQRFQFPAKDEEFGWLAATPTGMDIADGETYWDRDQAGLVFRGDSDWYMLQQPERFTTSTGTAPSWSKGDPKNIVCTRSGVGSQVVAVDDTDVVAGTVVRVYRQQPGSPTPGRIGRRIGQHVRAE